jgi:hypothetical protein
VQSRVVFQPKLKGGDDGAMEDLARFPFIEPNQAERPVGKVRRVVDHRHSP